jgi:hypothetical protein
MWVGLDAGRWKAYSDVAGAANHVRLESPTSSRVAGYTAAGVAVTADMHGPYSSRGVSGLDVEAYISNAVALVKERPEIVAVEILNEPGATWFWGSNAMSKENMAAYASLIRKVHAAFTENFGAARPKLIASYDGGWSHSLAWGRGVTAQDPQVWSFVDGITMHPYGGTSSRTASALGNRQNVIDAHKETGKDVYITEIGWPTASHESNTGDSFQWTESEQATNIVNFVNWAKATGFVRAVHIFAYQDYGTKDWYGITRSDGTRKPSYNALRSVGTDR